MSEVRRIGKYELLEESGRGGFAVVYKARDVTLNRIVALKVLFPHLTSDPKFVQRFQQEAQTAAQFHHPHIVTIYEVGQEKGIYYLTMTYLEGRTLDKVIAEGGLTLEQAVTILEQIAGALDLIHSRGLVHRDIKPANIMIGEDGQATLLDFGIVRAAEGTRLTTTMAVVGTPEYMAPEQAEVAEGVEIDWRADLYALSVVAYEMLVGKLPFTGSSPTAVLYKHVYEAPPRPTAANPDLLPGVEPVLLKGLAKKREERFQKASDFARQLRQAALTRQETPPPPVHAKPVSAKPSPAEPPRPPRAVRLSMHSAQATPSRILLGLVVGGGGLLLLGLLSFTVLTIISQGGRKSPTPTPTKWAMMAEPTRPPADVSTDEPTDEVRTDEPTDDSVTVETPCVFDAAIIQGPDFPWGVQVDPGEPFILNWRLSNTGNCNWETGTQLIPLEGNLQPGRVDFSPVSLSPGETMDVQVVLQAPEAPGIYEMILQLQAPDTSLFGPRMGFMLEVVSTSPLPDFVVTDIVVMEGDKLRCLYMNAGGVDASTEVLRIAFYVDGMRISESNVGSSAGGSASLAAGGESWLQTASLALPVTFEIGRASCRERV